MLKLPVEELLCVTMTTRLRRRWNGVKNRNQMFSCVKIASVLVMSLARVEVEGLFQTGSYFLGMVTSRLSPWLICDLDSCLSDD